MDHPRPNRCGRRLVQAACIVSLLWIPLACLAAEPPADKPDAEVLELVPGTVTEVGSFGFGLVPDSDPGTRYAPVEPLPESFQRDGLRVRFSGVVGDADEGAGRGGRRWGTPLEVTHIELLEEDADEPDEPASTES